MNTALIAALALAAPLTVAQIASAQTAPAQTAPAQTAPDASAAAAAPAPCGSIRGLTFICGMANVEDMIPVDGGKGIVAGSYKDGSVGFYLIDPATKAVRTLALTIAAKPDPMYGCPSPPDLTKLSTHGLDVRAGRNGLGTLYAINHGGRESVEVFNLDARKGSAEWIGCVVAPEGTSANSVVGLPDRSIVFTKLFDTTTRGQGISPVLQGQVTGTVYHWVPGKGVSEVPGSQLSGDNGLLASPDGKTLFINAYGTKEVWRVPLDGKGQRVSAKVEFNPDNLRWAPDGNIYVTGQFLNPANPAGPNDWGVARLDPKTMYIRTLITAPGMKEFDNATTAVQVGNLLWLGTFKGDRIAYMNAP
jgi:hypothetical protein